MENKSVTLNVTLQLKTNEDTDAEELAWILNLIRAELERAPLHWSGKVRRVEFVR